MLVDSGALFAGAAEQGAVFGVVGLGGVEQAGVDGRLIHLLEETFQFLDGRSQESSVGAAGDVDLAAVGDLEALGPAESRRQILFEPRVIDPTIQVAEIPDDAVGAAGRLGRLVHGLFPLITGARSASEDRPRWRCGLPKTHNYANSSSVI